MKKNNKTAFFTLIQCLYWITNCLMFSFASMFLLGRGFSNSAIGLVLGFSYGLSACLQPVIAAFVNKTGVRLSSFMASVYAVVAVLAAAILVLPLQGAVLSVVMVCTLMLQSSLQPSLNSLHRGYQLRGVQINFGFARGMGSAAFALISFVAGRLLARFGSNLIPALYLGSVLPMILCLALFRSPSFSTAGKGARAPRQSLLRSHPRFAVFLVGIVSLSLAHIFMDNFMLQIMRSIGGGSAEMGTAYAISAMTELPAMALYARLARKAGPNRILFFSGWFWLIKNILIMLAPSPVAVYAAEVLQALSYALYVPATVDYIARNLPQEAFLKGQALSGSAFTMGSLLASLGGGPLIDLMGMRPALVLIQVFSVLGAILFTVAVLPKRSRA